MIRVSVKMIGAVAASGKNTDTRTLPEGTAVSTLLGQLSGEGVLPSADDSGYSLLVNGKKADGNTNLCDGDEIIILRTLGGG